MARRMFILKECNALCRRKGCLDRSGSGKLERLAEVASFNKFGAPTLEGLRRWVRGIMSEAFAKSELLSIITEEVGHDCRGRDGLGIGEKDTGKLIIRKLSDPIKLSSGGLRFKLPSKFR